MNTIRTIIQNVLKALPNEGRYLKTSICKLMVQKELALIKMNQFHSSENLPDPRTVYWIAPDKIELHTSLKTYSQDWEDWVFPQHGHLKTIRNGDWDLSDSKVADMRICRAIDSRVSYGVCWLSTDYYQTVLRQIQAGRYVWGCLNRADLDRRCAEIDDLIESMAKTGYQESRRLGYAAGIDSSLGQQEIIVNIGRNGHLLFQDGRHRLAVARALKIEKIPIQILVRHSEWQVFRRYLQHLADHAKYPTEKGFLRQSPIHFDLTGIPSRHDCEDHWRTMADNLPEGHGPALDIGCNLGYFCHGLEQKGYTPIGVEYLPDIAYAAEKIARAENRRLQIISGDILSDDVQARILDHEFSVVVAINIFHHFITTETGFMRLERFMKNLKCRTLFFETHHSDTPKLQESYMNPSPAEFTRMIRDWGNFQSAVPIRTGPDGRTLFVLNR